MSKLMMSKGCGAAQKRRSQPSQYGKARHDDTSVTHDGQEQEQKPSSRYISQTVWETIRTLLEENPNGLRYNAALVKPVSADVPNPITAATRVHGFLIGDIASALECDSFDVRMIEAVAHQLSARDLIPIVARLREYVDEVGPASSATRRHSAQHRVCEDIAHSTGAFGAYKRNLVRRLWTNRNGGNANG